jgi:glucose-1-phosphate cytidylyltransferase
MANHHSVPVFILAGGLGTRLSEETHLIPKPLIEIGDLPILVHIMRWYYSFGFNDFVICAGYRSWEIKQFFLTYEVRGNNLVIDHRSKGPTIAGTMGRNPLQERWRVRVIDTGQNCMTGGRVAKAFDEIAQDQDFSDFAITYGDGLCDVDVSQELSFHREHGHMGTVLGVPPMARFGELDVTEDDKVRDFLEKPQSRQGLINGGFFLLKRDFRKYLEPVDTCILEREPLAKLAADGELKVFKHYGFWHPMDTLRDKIQLQELWDSGKAPWIPKKGE